MKRFSRKKKDKKKTAAAGFEPTKSKTPLFFLVDALNRLTKKKEELIVIRK
jgi:hypothetical protein